jgi:hypothetical protein
MYALLHPSIRHHYVPTSSSIHSSSLCTHFFIHPSIIIMYPFLHLSIFHPSIIIIPSRTSIKSGPVGRNVRHENHLEPGRPECGPRHRPGVKIKPGPVTEPRRPERGPAFRPTGGYMSSRPNHSNDILSIRFKHMRILRIFELF